MPILYYPLPIENALDGTEKCPSISRETIVDGVLTQVVQGDCGQWQVARVISTNPQDYLKPNLQPGSVVTFN